MSLPKRLSPEKTTFINLGEGNMLPISVLPQNIVEEFEVLEKMKRDLADLTYKVEIITLAIKSKTMELGTAVQNYIKSNEVSKQEKQE